MNYHFSNFLSYFECFKIVKNNFGGKSLIFEPNLLHNSKEQNNSGEIVLITDINKYRGWERISWGVISKPRGEGVESKTCHRI